MVPVTVAVTVLVLSTARVLHARVDAEARAELAHEGDNLRALAEEGDPRTGQPFATTGELLTRFLAHNRAERNEAFFSIVDGRAERRSAEPVPERLDLDRRFVARAAASAAPFSGTRSTRGGQAFFAVYPVSVSGQATGSALVIVEFTGAADRDANSVVAILGVVALVALAIGALAGWLVAGRVLAPIRAVREAAEHIDESDLTRRIDVVGDDDVAMLAVTFNRMLDRIEAAFETQTRFLEDTGHELRTPITIVRGHLEVMGDDPADRAQTIELVLSELTRMGRIIDDLMTIARSERPEFCINGPVDLAELTIEALAKVEAMAPRRWAIDELAEVSIWADGERLTQALVQLASNAVTHTSAGDRISVGAAVHDGRVKLWVADTGEGIDLSVQRDLFERFARGDRGDRSGAGLGLEIVARIAAAHGGEVSVESEPGCGSRFVLDLPRAAGPPGSTPSDADGGVGP